MKFRFKCLAAALLAVPLCSSALAEEQKPQIATPPAQPRMGGMEGMGDMGGMGSMDGMGMMMSEEHLKQKQDYMLKMHDYLNRILAAKDDKERERLKEEQRKLMKEHMEAHHQQMRQHMQMMMQHGGSMKPGQPMQHGGGMGGMSHGERTQPSTPQPSTSPTPAPQPPAGH